MDTTARAGTRIVAAACRCRSCGAAAKVVALVPVDELGRHGTARQIVADQVVYRAARISVVHHRCSAGSPHREPAESPAD